MLGASALTLVPGLEGSLTRPVGTPADQRGQLFMRALPLLISLRQQAIALTGFH